MYSSQFNNDLGVFERETILYSQYNVQLGRNIIEINPPAYLSKNTVIYLYQFDGRVAVDSSGNSSSSDYSINGPAFFSIFPEPKYVYQVSKLNSNTNWRFLIQATVYEIDYNYTEIKRNFLKIFLHFI